MSDEEASKTLIAARIKQRMRDLGLSQAELKSVMGVSQATVSRWVSGKDSPKGRWMSALADALQTSADYLTGREEKNGDEPDIIAAFIQAVRELAAEQRIRRKGSQLPPALIDRIEAEAPSILSALDQASGGAFAALSEAEQEEVLQRLARRVAELARRQP